MLVFSGDTKARGCYHQMMEASVLGKGAILSIPGSSESTYPGSGGSSGTPDPYVVTGVGFTQKERFNIVECFNDRNYTYAFGHDPGGSMLSVSFVAFITNTAGQPTAESLKALTSAYARGRLTASQKYVTLTIGDGVTYSGFLVGMRTATLNPEYNLQTVTLDILLVEVQNG